MFAFRHRLQFAAYRVTRGCLNALPVSVACRMLGTLLWGAQEMLGWRKAETRRRIAQLFPTKTAEEQRRIRRGALRNLACNMVELIRREVPPEMNASMTATLDAVEVARQAGKGVILVIVHSGNWDLAGILAAKRGIPMCFIARKQKNEHLYRELLRAREAGGGVVVDRDAPGLLRQLIQFLAGNGVLAILIDIRSRQASETYTYLGHPAPLSNGLGLLAAKSGAEVLPIFLGRDAQFRHEWKSFPPRRLSATAPKSARNDLLQSCLDILSPEVLRNPESYFWFNKRWVLEPHAPEAGEPMV